MSLTTRRCVSSIPTVGKTVTRVSPNPHQGRRGHKQAGSIDRPEKPNRKDRELSAPSEAITRYRSNVLR
jgi:hypothetical protein